MRVIFANYWSRMKINDIDFRILLSEEQLQGRVKQLAKALDKDYKRKTPLFLPVLNGSFIFAADLLRELNGPSRVSFVKHASYTGTSSSGQLKSLIGLQESVFKQDVVIVEDIIDTGLTIQRVVEELTSLGTSSVEVVALLRKERSKTNALQPKYIGFDIADEFVVGYGLDHDGLGRNLKDLWQQGKA